MTDVALALLAGLAAGAALGAAFVAWLHASLPRPGAGPPRRGPLVAGSLLRVLTIAAAFTGLAALAPLALAGALPGFLVGRAAAVRVAAPPTAPPASPPDEAPPEEVRP